MKFSKFYRRGLTLTEVLVSIFILSIGLMALMALFPIGALQMAQAMKDDRTATAAANAERLFRAYWKNSWLDTTGALQNETNVQLIQPAIACLDNRNGPYSTISATTNPVAAAYLSPLPTAYYSTVAPAALNLATQSTTDSMPSFPVFIDPIGFALEGRTPTIGPGRTYWLAGTNNVQTKLIPRRDLQVGTVPSPFNALLFSGPSVANVFMGPTFLSTNTIDRISTCTLLDDYTFYNTESYGAAAAGVPPGAITGNTGNGDTGSVKREGDYNYAWMIQRLKNNIRAEVNLNVVVFRRRAPSDVANGEKIFMSNPNNNPITLTDNINANYYGVVGYTSGSSTVTLNYNNCIPAIKRGNWILNASSYAVTDTQPGGGTSGATSYNRQFADFYRVISVTQTATSATAGTLELELQTPLKPLPVPTPYTGAAYTLPSGARRTISVTRSFNVMIVMDNVIEVFDRGTISAFDKPAP